MRGRDLHNCISIMFTCLSDYLGESGVGSFCRRDGIKLGNVAPSKLIAASLLARKCVLMFMQQVKLTMNSLR